MHFNSFHTIMFKFSEKICFVLNLKLNSYSSKQYYTNLGQVT